MKVNKRAKEGLVKALAPLVVFVAFFALWEALVKGLNIQSWILPAPSAIFTSMVKDFKDYWPHILKTAETIGLGFLLSVPVGLLVAILVTSSPLISSAMGPYIIILVTTPMITVVPLLQLWLGYGMNVRVVTVVIQSFAVVNMNACTGFLNVPTIRHELMQSLGANRVQRYLKVNIPSAASDIFTGISMAGIFATTACISAEYCGGNEGLGSQIITYSRFYKSEKAFACILFVMILGVVLYCVIKWLQNRIIKWKI